MTLDPETFTQVYNDPFVKKYHCIDQASMGQNLIKFNGIQPGGVSMNGDSYMMMQKKKLLC